MSDFETILKEASSAVKAPIARPRMYISGFPKSGLHLAQNMVSVMFEQWSCGKLKGWFGTNAWTTERHYLEQIGMALASIENGQYAKGHTGYLTSIDLLLQALGIGLVFVYRDLRDVVVSQMYHILSEDDDRLKHPDKDLYRQMESKEEIMLAIIKGVDKYDGIIKRWETYAPWLDQDWVLPMRFSFMNGQKRAAANRFFDYSFEIAEKENGKQADFLNPTLREVIVDQMVEQMKDKSTTYRKGKSGGWKEEFTPRVVDAFKEYDNGWLVKLGFEKDEKWQ